MAGSSVYPGALDNFAEASPTNLGDNDSTGRTHSERHDDVEAAVEAVQGELGLNPSGAFATVRQRLDDLDEGFGNTSSVTSTTPGTGSKVFTVNSIGSYVVGSYVVVSSLANPLTIFMVGKISAISGLSITVLVESAQGAAAADWVFSLTGPQPTIAQVINVNTSTPALRVTQTGTGPALLVEDSALPDATPFVVTASGNVGIGTSSPLAKLQIGDGTDGAFLLQSGNTTFVGHTIRNIASTASIDTVSYLDTQNQNSVIDGNIFFTHRVDGSADFSVSTTPSGSKTSDRRVQRFLINGDGNVGIGTSSPDVPLTVAGTGALTGAFDRYAANAGQPSVILRKSRGAAVGTQTAVTNTDGLGGIFFQGSDGTSFSTGAGIESVVSGTVGASDVPAYLRFNTKAAGVAISEKMRLDGNGLIIGTGTSLGAWTAYTPTWTNLTVGSAVQDHYYVQIGKTVHVHGVITFAANTSISGDLLLTLPIAARNANVSRPFGVTQFFDSSSGGAFVGYCNQSGTTTVNLRVINSSGTYATREAVSASIPFTWAVSDVIRYSYTYEAA